MSDSINLSKTKLYSSDNSREEDEILLEPYNFIATLYTDDDNMLNTIYKSFNYWLELSDEKLQELLDLIQPIYNNVYIVDDIQDNSLRRKGVPTIHTIFGIDRTLTAVNYAQNVVLQKYVELQRPEATNIYIQGGKGFFKGQGIEIYWRDNFICPTEEEYIEMLNYKVGYPILYGIQFLQLFSENKSNFDKIAKYVGIFMQIFNDYINLRSEKYMRLKVYCEDIGEGKFTLPLIHAIHTHPEDDQILQILKQKTADEETKKYCMGLLQKYGSFEYTRRVMEKYRNNIVEEMKNLGENPSLMQIVDCCYFKIEEDACLY